MGAFCETLIPGSSKNLWLFTRKTDQKAEMLHIWKIQVYLSAYHYLGLPQKGIRLDFGHCSFGGSSPFGKLLKLCVEFGTAARHWEMFVF